MIGQAGQGQIMENLECQAKEFGLDKKGHDKRVQTFKAVNNMILEVLTQFSGIREIIIEFSVLEFIAENLMEIATLYEDKGLDVKE